MDSTFLRTLQFKQPAVERSMGTRAVRTAFSLRVDLCFLELPRVTIVMGMGPAIGMIYVAINRTR